MKPKFEKINRLSKKIAKKTGLSYYDIDAILKVASYEIIETLKNERKFYWDDLGVFYIALTSKGVVIKLKLDEHIFEKLNEKNGERVDEIIFE